MNKPTIVLIGMTGAGKSTVASALCERHNLIRIKNTTTRPQRGPEDNEYVFASTEDFLRDENRYVSVRKYHAILEDVYKDYYYGVDKQALGNGGILITDFDGLLELFERGENVVGVYLYADYETRRQRAENRPGFKLEEFERRNKDDLIRFDVKRIVETGKSYPMYLTDNNHDKSLQDVCTQVEELLKKYM